MQELLEQVHETCYIRQALMEFKHPKYYKEMRAERKKLQASSFKHGGRRERPTVINEIHDEWALNNGYKASSCKPQASSGLKLQAASLKPQAASFKLQAASYKLHDSRTTEHLITIHGSWTEGLDQDKCIVWMCLMKGNLVW